MEPLDTHQLKIINRLMFMTQARFSQLNSEGMYTDHFNYHVRKLIQLGYLLKDEQANYTLSYRGKAFAARMDAITSQIEKQPTIIVVAVCIYTKANREYVLVHKRKKHPSFGYYSFPEGKVKFGELLESAVLRKLREETGLIGKNPILKEMKHKVLKKDGDEIIKDTILYVYKISDFEGDLHDTQEGENYWMGMKEFLVKASPA